MQACFLLIATIEQRTAKAKHFRKFSEKTVKTRFGTGFTILTRKMRGKGETRFNDDHQLKYDWWKSHKIVVAHMFSVPAASEILQCETLKKG